VGDGHFRCENAFQTLRYIYDDPEKEQKYQTNT
jgi:hypothetical protein